MKCLDQGRSGSLRWVWLGRMGFEGALALQEELVVEHSRVGDTLLLLEHDPVYTTSRRGKSGNLPDAPGIPVHRIGRGGDVTYHGPGQLVGYVLVDLRARGGDVHRFLRSLERGVIGILGDLGVTAGRVEGRTGVWVDSHRGRDVARKIASIGIGVRRGISMHGFAVNLSVDLDAFDRIVACDLPDAVMTSVEQEIGRSPEPGEIAAKAGARVASALDSFEPEAVLA